MSSKKTRETAEEHHNIRFSRFKSEISKCVRCGSCKAYCPTYDETASEAMSARGRLMLLLGLMTGRLQPTSALNEKIFSCLLCGSCSGTCPRGVDVIGALHYGRTLLCKSDYRRKHLRWLVRTATNHPRASFTALRTLKTFAGAYLSRKGFLPFVPDLPDDPFRKTDQVYRVAKRRGRVAVFLGCSSVYLFPHLGESLISVLHTMGYEVVLPQGEVCCGAPLLGLGLEREAIQKAEKNLRAFGRLKVDAVISLCPTCILMLKKQYHDLTGKGLDKAMDISVFLMDKLPLLEPSDKTASYHDPCHLKFGLGIWQEPRELIRHAGIAPVNSGDSACCGLGGTFCMSYKDMSDNLRLKCAQTLAENNPDIILTSCPGCMLNLGRTITDRPVLHLIELIEELYCNAAVKIPLTA